MRPRTTCMSNTYVLDQADFWKKEHTRPDRRDRSSVRWRGCHRLPPLLRDLFLATAQGAVAWTLLVEWRVQRWPHPRAHLPTAPPPHVPTSLASPPPCLPSPLPASRPEHLRAAFEKQEPLSKPFEELSLLQCLTRVGRRRGCGGHGSE